MALFGRKKQAENAAEKSRKGVKTPAAPAARPWGERSAVLLRPRITEKASRLMEGGVYTFEVAQSAGKREVAAAVQEIFQVTPRKITIVNHAPRTTHSRARGREVTVHGLRKAQVFLKKGESITLA